jgi:hypothetical protein
MIKCGIRKLYLLTVLLVLGPYLWTLGHMISNGTVKTGELFGLTLIFIFPIYLALFQVKTIEIKDGLITIFYPFRLWTKSYKLDEIERWKYRKTTKTFRFEAYFRSRYVVLKFKGSVWLTALFSVGLTNFDALLNFLNEKHKDRRTNKFGR